MRKIDLLFAEYAESHRNPTNKLIHWICVPLIFWAILGFISYIPTPNFYIRNFGYLSIASGISLIFIALFYLRLSWRISLMMFIVMLIMEYFISSLNLALGRISWTVYLSVFILSWIGQFYGHKVEGKNPSFLKDLQFLLVGPIWLLHFILKKTRIRY